MKRLFSIILSFQFLIFYSSSFAQQSLSLEKAYELAEKNYPLIRQRDLIKQTAAISIDNLNKGYLPQLSFNGQITYQSDVTTLDFTLPGFQFNPLSRDQYKVVADVNQVIFDGGVIKQQKIASQLNEATEEQKVEVELYKLRDRIQQIFLSALFLDDQLQQAELMKKDLQTGIKTVEAQVNNGVLLRSNLNVLKAELLKADQRSIELNSSRKGVLQTLGIFINQQLNENTVLEKPVSPAITDNSIVRPELQLYKFQAEQLGQQSQLIRAKNLPKTSLFAQGGYGKPGFNFLKDGFTFYYIGGIRINWPLAGLYTQKKEKDQVKINQKIIDIQKETFLLNTNSQLTQQRSEIDKLNKLIESDKDIIELREQVKKAAKAQLENNVITTNDFLKEVNAEDLARQSLIIHQIQLLQAQINYQTILGKQ